MSETTKTINDLQIGDQIQYKPSDLVDSGQYPKIHHNRTFYASVIAISPPESMVKLSVGWLKPVKPSYKYKIAPEFHLSGYKPASRPQPTKVRGISID